MRISLLFFLLLSVYLTVEVHCFFQKILKRTFCHSENCYEILGTSPSAPLEDIQALFYKKIEQVNKKHNYVKKKKILKAYKILSNKRTKRYYDFYLQNPKSIINAVFFLFYWFYKILNGLFITFGIFFVLSLFQYVQNKYQIKEIVTKCSNNKIFRKRVNSIISEKHPTFNSYDKKKKEKIQKKIEEEIAQEMVCIKNGETIKKLKFQDLLVVQIFLLPKLIYSYISWNIHWFIQYFLLKNEYKKEDKIYLTRKYMNIPTKKWELMENKEQEKCLNKKLWVKENLKQYLDEQKEIERLNKIESSKYKKELRSRKKGTSYNYND